MVILNLGGINEPSEQPSKKKLKVIIGIGLLAGVMGMGSTLAATITLNGGSTVEFGQGVQYVTACDASITVTPASTFVNGSAGADATQSNFALTSVKLSGIESGCVGKTLTLNAYTDSATVGGTYTSNGSGQETALGFGESYTASTSNFNGGGILGTAVNTGCVITVTSLTSYSATCNKFVTTAVTPTSPTSGEVLLTFNRVTVTIGGSTVYVRPILAAAVDKFSLESSAV